MNNDLWSAAELAIIDDGVAGDVPIEALLELLPHRSTRAIGKKIVQRTPKDLAEMRGSCPKMLDRDEPGIEDGEMARRRLRARLGSAALLKAIRRAHPKMVAQP